MMPNGTGAVALLLLLIPLNFWFSRKLIDSKHFLFNLILFINLILYFYIVIIFFILFHYLGELLSYESLASAHMNLIAAGLFESIITTSLITLIFKGQIKMKYLKYIYFITFFPALIFILARWIAIGEFIW